VNCLRRLIGANPPKPAVGMGKRLFAIGDIHGRHDLLDALLKGISRHVAAAPPADIILVFLGDYVDRGPASQAVIERLCGLERKTGWRCVFLRGNHDQAVLEFLKDPSHYSAWRGYGAAETLVSYGVMPPRFESASDFDRAWDDFSRKFPPHHLEFLAGLKYFHIEDDYLFVHAGIRPGIALADQTPEDMMWIREIFLSHRGRFEKMVVHGHTPAPAPVMLPNRICVDTGAHATGRLTALVLEDKQRTFLEARNTAPRREVMPRLQVVNS
jgi:serine/threonine protein phosphatase 1